MLAASYGSKWYGNELNSYSWYSFILTLIAVGRCIVKLDSNTIVAQRIWWVPRGLRGQKKKHNMCSYSAENLQKDWRHLSLPPSYVTFAYRHMTSQKLLLQACSEMGFRKHTYAYKLVMYCSCLPTPAADTQSRSL
jgi:hypothetical protein